jgi:large subunit ribosomal protein L23
MDYTQILLKPVVTEKMTFVKEAANQVIFYVHTQANKIQVRQAIEQAFGVKVLAVNLINKKPSQRRRQGRTIGRISGYKKAYITLAPGEKIDFFEGV